MNINDDGARVTASATHQYLEKTTDVERMIVYSSMLLREGYKLNTFEVKRGRFTNDADVLVATFTK